jgi:hypothetical protein
VAALLCHRFRKAIPVVRKNSIRLPSDRGANAKRSLDSLLNLLIGLVGDGLLFFCFLFRARTALCAEVLFLRKQLAFYEERQVQPRRLNDSARFSLTLWSRLCNWKDALEVSLAKP